MEATTIVIPNSFVPKITIQNPKQKGSPRFYTSKKEVNGWMNQTFTSDDYPDSFPGVFIHEDEDPGNGKMHSSYLTVVTKKPWEPYGQQGWRGWRELDLIPRKLLAQEDFSNVRSVRESDLKGIELPKGKYWLADPTFKIDRTGTHFYMKYVDNGKIKTVELCHEHNSIIYLTGSNIGAGILAVVTLNDVIRKNTPKEKPRSLWQSY